MFPLFKSNNLLLERSPFESNWLIVEIVIVVLFFRLRNWNNRRIIWYERIDLSVL